MSRRELKGLISDLNETDRSVRRGRLRSRNVEEAAAMSDEEPESNSAVLELQQKMALAEEQLELVRTESEDAKRRESESADRVSRRSGNIVPRSTICR